MRSGQKQDEVAALGSEYKTARIQREHAERMVKFFNDELHLGHRIGMMRKDMASTAAKMDEWQDKLNKALGLEATKRSAWLKAKSEL